MAKIGAHVSAAGGLFNAPLNARAEGLETFQMFSRPPQSFQCPPLPDTAVKQFLKTVKECGFTSYYIHAPYLVNLASANNALRHGSITMVRQELERGTKLGVRGVMFHTGSATSQPSRAMATQVAIQSLNRILAGYTGSCLLLLENAAGSGNVLGHSFPDLALLYKGIQQKKQVGFCLDTQHAFASGYDLRTQVAVNKTVADFDQYLGLKKLMVIQINDSKVPFDCKKDRHEHIRIGCIGRTGMGYIINHPKLRHLDFILETKASGRADDVAILKQLRQQP